MPHFPIKIIVLHYSATCPDQDYGVAEVRKMHLARGFNDVGYHSVIRRNGTVEKGRPDTTVGAHVSGHNTGSLGICYIDGIERATGPKVGVNKRTKAQKATMVKRVRSLLAQHRGAEVLFHRTFGATQCSGFDVRSWRAVANARRLSWTATRRRPCPLNPPPPSTAPPRAPSTSSVRWLLASLILSPG